MATQTGASNPYDLLPGIKTTFMKAYKAAPLIWQMVATTVPSTLRTETYAWLGQAPQVREFIDERVPKGLSEFHFSITNRKWENTLAVTRDDIEDEQYGQIMIRAGQLGDKAAMHRNILIWSLFSNGNSQVCYDGSNFFSATHQENLSPTQANYGTSALGSAAFGAAKAAMLKFTDDTGIIANIQPTELIVPPQLEEQGRLLLNADFIANDAGTVPNTNIWKGAASLEVVPWLTSSATSWFLLDDTQFVKPIIFQIKKEMELKVLDGSSDSESAFMTDKWHYGTRARYNAGFGDWRMAFGSFS